MFESVYPGGAAASSGQPSGIRFHPASDHDEAATARAQADCRRRLLRSFVQRGLIDAQDAKEMNEREHGAGGSKDASVRIDGADRSGLERLLRYCARPPFAMERLHPHGPGHLLYHCPKPQPGRTTLIFCSRRSS